MQVAEALHDFFGTTTAPDCSVECVGVHYTKSWRHKLELLAGDHLSCADYRIFRCTVCIRHCASRCRLQCFFELFQ